MELLKNHEKALDKIASLKANKTSWYFVLLSFISLAIWCFVIYKFGWNDMEQWTYIFTLLLVVVNLIYYAVFEKNFTNETLKEEKLKKVKVHIFQLYKFDNNQTSKINYIPIPIYRFNPRYSGCSERQPRIKDK